jgi:raffinose/stachyose/melibiose transport system substrate-binding protein
MANGCDIEGAQPRVGFLRRVWKYGSLLAVLAVSAWLLWPPGAATDASGQAAAARAGGRDAKYVIKFSPGGQYVPGSVPFGIGKPLEGLAKVISRFERRFPDTHIEIINVPTVREYLVTQLSSGAAPDIINVNVEDVWVDVQKGWYIPLDGFLEAPNPFVAEKRDPNLPGARQWWDVFRYQAISRGKAAPDGRNYCITMDMIETGIFYNKTIFAKLGLAVPETWPQFLAVLARLKQEPGLTPLLMYLGDYNDWATDLIFDQLYYNLLPGIDLVKDPAREPYLQGYLDGDELVFLLRKGFFGPRDARYRDLWRIMRELKRYTNDDMTNADLTRQFVTRHGAMIWTSSPMTYRLWSDHKLGFEWGVFYPPRFTRETSPYASDTDMCVIGGAATQFEVTCSAVGDTDASLPLEERMARSERLRRVVAFLQFLCTPEQNEQVVNEYPCLMSNIVGVPVLAPLAPFEKILERRYTTTKWIFSFDLRFSHVQERMLGLYLAGGASLDEFLVWQKANLDTAAENLMRRKATDFPALEAQWKRLAPVRAKMADLPPDDAREDKP